MRNEIIFPILFAGLPHATIAEFRSLAFRFNGAELERFDLVVQRLGRRGNVVSN